MYKEDFESIECWKEGFIEKLDKLGNSIYKANMISIKMYTLISDRFNEISNIVYTNIRNIKLIRNDKGIKIKIGTYG